MHSQHNGGDGQELPRGCELDPVVHLLPVGEQPCLALVWSLEGRPLHCVQEDVHALQGERPSSAPHPTQSQTAVALCDQGRGIWAGGQGGTAGCLAEDMGTRWRTGQAWPEESAHRKELAMEQTCLCSPRLTPSADEEGAGCWKAAGSEGAERGRGGVS